MDIDLEKFVETGRLGLIDSSSSLSDIVGMLGEPDPSAYSGIYGYGPIGFDFAGSAEPPCAILINLSPALRPSASRTPLLIFPWPDSRFNWSFGAFQRGATLTQVQSKLTCFEEQEFLEHTDNKSRVFYNSESKVQIVFEPQNNVPTLSLIAKFPD